MDIPQGLSGYYGKRPLSFEDQRNASVRKGNTTHIKIVSPAILTSFSEEVFVAFNGQVSWYISSGFGLNPLFHFDHLMGTGKVIGDGDFSMLASGYSIGSGASFNSSNHWLGLNGQSGYIGVEFRNGKDRHYGWMEASVDFFGEQLIISSWAYDDVPYDSIAAAYHAKESQ